jgi:hypothetical protein
MPPEDAIAILARWTRELRRDLRMAEYRIRRLELRLAIQERAPLDDLHSYWLERHTPDSIVQLAAELEAV